MAVVALGSREDVFLPAFREFMSNSLHLCMDGLKTRASRKDLVSFVLEWAPWFPEWKVDDVVERCFCKRGVAAFMQKHKDDPQFFVDEDLEWVIMGGLPKNPKHLEWFFTELTKAERPRDMDDWKMIQDQHHAERAECNLCANVDELRRLHPCRHGGMCVTCIRKLRACPYCRAPFTSYRAVCKDTYRRR